MALTPKQAAFVGEYLTDLNATAAAERAGYKKPNQQGPRLLVNVGVAAAIAEAQDARARRTQLTQDMVIDGLLSETRFTGEGSSHGARVSAWGLLGKHLGMFRDKLDVNLKGHVTVVGGIDLAAVVGAKQGLHSERRA